MRVSLNWLGELVEILDPEALPRMLTFAGLEVERVERLGEGLDGVIVAKILAAKPHPKADKLSVTEVDAGGRTLQIVCGAKNFKVGDLVPLALPGTTLPGGQTIAEAELRGVKSAGMLCSQRELGLSEDHEGLWILPGGSPGQKLTDAQPFRDTVLDLNVTPNRADCLSHWGVAREIYALTQGAWDLRPPQVSRWSEAAQPLALPAPRILAPDRCTLFAGQVGIVGEGFLRPSPLWMQARLSACGVRPLGLAVDITNYVMLELGQPLHAYDLDRLKTGIVVRLAKSGERLTTLDGAEREVTADDLLICDGEVPIGLAGVMGGAATAVDASTRRLYLEAAHFTPAGIRRTAKRHGLPSEAAHRFERGVSPQLPYLALPRAVELLSRCGEASSLGSAQACVAERFVPRRIAVTAAHAAQLLGTPVREDELEELLAREQIGRASDGSFSIPPFRPDLTGPEDLIAEVGRLKGFDQIAPRPLPPMPPPADGARVRLAAAVRRVLCGLGFDEVVQYSFLAGPLSSRFGEGSVRLVNPLKQEQGRMRASLLPSLCETARFNLAHLTRDAGVEPSVRLFEIARTYAWPAADERSEGPVMERLMLGLLWHGPRQPLGWGTPRDLADVHDLRGVLDALSEGLDLPFFLDAAEQPFLHPRSSATVRCWERGIGFGGELHPSIAADHDLPRQLLLAELDLGALLSQSDRPKRSHDVAKFPAVLRDVALVVPEHLGAARLQSELEMAAGPLLERLTLFDVYKGTPLQASEKSLAYSLRFRAADRTLTEPEVAGALKAMVAAAEKLGARLRS